MGSKDTEEESRRGSGITEIEQIIRLGERADSDPVHRPPPVAGSCSVSAERVERGGGRQHVLALQQTRDFGSSDGERSEHQRAMGNRLIAGNSNRACEGTTRL